MTPLPPLTWLQAFEAAARTLSFTAAGRELGVTQAAISQRIRLLEDRLGHKLFVRHPRSLTLTPARPGCPASTTPSRAWPREPPRCSAARPTTA